MTVELVVERRYLERGRPRVEQVTWRHLPEAVPRWTFQRRRWRRPKMVQVAGVDSVEAARGRELPGWCAPGMEPNRWVWTAAVNHAADLGWIEADGIDAFGNPSYAPPSLWWSYYEIPLRDGCVLS